MVDSFLTQSRRNWYPGGCTNDGNNLRSNHLTFFYSEAYDAISTVSRKILFPAPHIHLIEIGIWSKKTTCNQPELPKKNNPRCNGRTFSILTGRAGTRSSNTVPNQNGLIVLFSLMYEISIWYNAETRKKGTAGSAHRRHRNFRFLSARAGPECCLTQPLVFCSPQCAL